MKREIRDYLSDILNECQYLLERMETIDYSNFIKNEDLKKAFVRSLEVIGEAVKKVPSQLKEKYSQISWQDVAGMRDKLIHEYFGVDYEVVWKTVKEEIPHLANIIEKIINDLAG